MQNPVQSGTLRANPKERILGVGGGTTQREEGWTQVLYNSERIHRQSIVGKVKDVGTGIRTEDMGAEKLEVA